jgi:polyphosphate kinase
MLRKQLHKHINAEIKNAKQKKAAAITLKMNSLSDEDLIDRLYDAAKAGVEIKLIVRGIFCMLSENNKFKKTCYSYQYRGRIPGACKSVGIS